MCTHSSNKILYNEVVIWNQCQQFTRGKKHLLNNNKTKKTTTVTNKQKTTSQPFWYSCIKSDEHFWFSTCNRDSLISEEVKWSQQDAYFQQPPHKTRIGGSHWAAKSSNFHLQAGKTSDDYMTASWKVHKNINSSLLPNYFLLPPFSPLFTQHKYSFQHQVQDHQPQQHKYQKTREPEKEQTTLWTATLHSSVTEEKLIESNYPVFRSTLPAEEPSPTPAPFPSPPCQAAPCGRERPAPALQHCFMQKKTGHKGTLNE